MEGKVIQFDWDFINNRDTELIIAPCLTNAERYILLTMTDYIGWETRWVSPTGEAIDQDKIDAWRDSIVNKLSFGGCEVDCNDVWACLGIVNIPGSLLAWLIEQLTGNGEVVNIVNDPSSAVVASPIIDDAMYTNCDNDYLWGFIIQLVRFINTALTNAYERLELLTDTLEFYQAIADEVPIMTEVTDFVAYLQDSIIEAYLAGYDETYEQEIACALFCMARQSGNCTLTWDEMYEYFLDRFGAGLANKNILDLLQFVLGGGWSGTEWCDASFAIFCGLLYYNQDFFGLRLPAVQRWWETFQDDPSNDWESLCDVCTYELLYEYNEEYQNDFDPVQGFWANPYALFSTESTPYGIKISQTYGETFDGLQKVAIRTLWNGSGVPTVRLTVTYDGGQDVMYLAVADESYREFTLPDTRDGVSFIEFYTATADGISVAYDKIRLTGIGDNIPPMPVNPE